MRAGRGPHACGCEHVLDAERYAGEGAGIAARKRCIRLYRHRLRLVRRFQHERIERARLAHRRHMRVGQRDGGKFPLAQQVAGLSQRQRGEIAHREPGSSQRKGFGCEGRPPTCLMRILGR